LSRTHWLRWIVQFDWFVGRSFWWAPVGGLVAMAGIIAAEVAGAAALKLLCAAALVGLVAGFFGLIALNCWLCGVIGYCRAWRDGFISIGLIKLVAAVARGGLFAVAGVQAVLRFVGL
jgi:hypothetical protein